MKKIKLTPISYWANSYWPNRFWSAALLLILLLAACQQSTDSPPEITEGPQPELVERPQPEPVEGDLIESDSAQATLFSYSGAIPEGALARLGRGSIDRVTFSPDDRYIAAAGEVGVYLYAAATLQEVWHIPTTSPIFSLAFSPDGRWLASGAANGVVNLIQAVDGRVVQGSPPNNDEANGVNALAWSDGRAGDDGQLLAIGFNDGNVAISRISSEGGDQPDGSHAIEILGTLDRSPLGVTSLAFSPNGQVLATGDRSGRINLWDADSFTWFGVLEGHEGDHALLDLAWSPDGDRLLSGGRDGKVILWDLLTFEPLHQIEGSAEPLVLSYSPDGQSFAVASGDGELAIRQSADPYQEESIQTVQRELAGAAFPSHWENLAAYTPSGELALWPVKGDPGAGPLISLAGHSPSIVKASAAAWSPDGHQLATSLDDRVILWDTTTWEPLQTLTGHQSGVTALAWSPTGDELASAGRDQLAIVWDLESGQPRLRLTGHSRNVTDLAYSPDGSQLATAGSLDNIAIIWDLASGQATRRIPGRGDGVWSVAWSPDGETLALGLNSGHVYLWDLTENPNQGPTAILLRHAAWVSGMAFSPDGLLLASVGGDGRLLLTRLEDDKARTYAGHLGPIRRVSFSPDGAMVATAGLDGTTIIRDAHPEASTDPLFIHGGHTDSINDVSWSPDSLQLASASDDGTAIVWEITTGD